MKIGVALSGGGIKSFSQIPLMETMVETGIKIDSISGTSMGAAIAALVASGVPVSVLEEKALQIEKHLVDTKLFKKPSSKVLPFSKEKIVGGYVDGDAIEKILGEVLEEYGVEHITDVKIPLAIPAVDLKTGKLVVFVSHPELFKGKTNWDIRSDITLAKAVRASCSFPMVIAACPFDNYLLADGGVKMNLPAELNHAYKAERVIGVTMNSEGEFEDMDSLFALGNRVYDLMVAGYDELLESQVDLMINVPIGNIWVFELGRGDEVIAAGKETAQKHKDNFKSMTVETGVFGKIFKRKGKTK